MALKEACSALSHNTLLSFSSTHSLALVATSAGRSPAGYKGCFLFSLLRHLLCIFSISLPLYPRLSFRVFHVHIFNAYFHSYSFREGVFYIIESCVASYVDFCVLSIRIQLSAWNACVFIDHLVIQNVNLHQRCFMLKLFLSEKKSWDTECQRSESQ